MKVLERVGTHWLPSQITCRQTKFSNATRLLPLCLTDVSGDPGITFHVFRSFLEVMPISIQLLCLRMHFPSPSVTSTTSTHCSSISTTSSKTQTKQAQTQTHIDYDSRQRKMCCGYQTDYKPSPNSRTVSARAWHATRGPNTYPMTRPRAYDGGRSGGGASVSGGPVIWYANVG